MRVQLEVRSILHVLFRHKRRILLCVAVGTIAAVSYDLIATPRYQANIQLLVKNTRSVVTPNERTVGTAGDSNAAVSSDLMQVVASSYNEILKSDDVASQVIQAIGVGTLYPKLAANPPSSGTLLGAAMRQFSKDAQVEQVKATNLISVSYKHPDPEVAKRVVGKMVEVFLNKQGRMMANPETDFMKQRVEHAAKALEIAQVKLADFRLKNQMSEAESEIVKLTDARYALQGHLRDEQMQEASLRGQLGNLGSSIKKHVPVRISLSSDNDLRFRAVDEVAAKLVTLRQQEEIMLRNYQENSDPVVRLRGQIRLLEDSLRKLRQERTDRQGANPVYQDLSKEYYEVSSQLSAASSSLQEIRRQQKEVETQIAALYRNQGTYDDLRRTVDLNESAYRKAVDDYQHSQSTEAMNTNRITDVAPVSDPQVGDKPVSPAKLLNLIFGVVGGFIFGVAMALLAEMMDDRLTTPAQVEDMIGIPVLVSFPRPEEEEPATPKRKKWYWPF